MPSPSFYSPQPKTSSRQYFHGTVVYVFFRNSLKTLSVSLMPPPSFYRPSLSSTKDKLPAAFSRNGTKRLSFKFFFRNSLNTLSVSPMPPPSFYRPSLSSTKDELPATFSRNGSGRLSGNPKSNKSNKATFFKCLLFYILPSFAFL